MSRFCSILDFVNHKKNISGLQKQKSTISAFNHAPAPVNTNHAFTLEPRILFDAAGALTMISEGEINETDMDNCACDNALPITPDNGSDTAAELLNSALLTLSGTESSTDALDSEEHIADTPLSLNARREIVFIDQAIENYGDLLTGVSSSAEIVLIDGDGIHQITEYLKSQQGIDAIHILSHGGMGFIELGDDHLSLETLNQDQSAIQSWGNALTENGDILLYGCNVSGNSEGQDFIRQLSELTGADVAASDDITGHATLSGNWNLESQTGIIEPNFSITDNMSDSFLQSLAVVSGTELLEDMGADTTDGINTSGWSTNNTYYYLTGTTHDATAVAYVEVDTNYISKFDITEIYFACTGDQPLDAGGFVLTGYKTDSTTVSWTSSYETYSQFSASIVWTNLTKIKFFADSSKNQEASASPSWMGVGSITFGTVTEGGGDTTSPTVTSVSATTADGTYGISDTIDITVTFDESVTVTGTPQITLETGTSDAVVDYSSGSGSATLTFQYTISAGESSSDLAYLSTSALDLNGGTIADSSANTATLTLSTPGAANSLSNSKALVVDGVAPTVSSVSATTADGTYGISDTIDITVTFDESVTVTGTPQITLETGTSDAIVDYSSGSGSATLTFQYTVSAGETSSDLDYISTSALALNSGTILDSAGNAATLTLASPGAANSLGNNKALALDTTAPTVTDGNVSISGSSGTSGAYIVGDTITATWDNTGSGDNNSDINTVTVDFSSFGGGAAVSATNSSETWTATYTLVSGSIDGTSLNVSVTATDDASNATTTSDSTNATVDNQVATVTDGNLSITSSGSGTSGAYIIGDTITAQWDNTGSGDNNGDISTVTMDFSSFGGGSAVSATNSSDTWSASYTVVSGSIDSSSLNVSASASDDAGNSATTTSDTSNLTLDNQVPVVTDGNISITSSGSGTSGAYIVGDTVTVQWDNTGSGDNNGDIASVTVDFSAFGGGASVSATNSSDTWTASYTIVSGTIDSSSLNASVSATDDAANTATTTADSSNLTLDNQEPSVNSVSVPSDGTYVADDTLDFTVNFDEAVTVDTGSGTPTISFDLGGSTKSAAYLSGSTTTALVFRYTVISDDIDLDGITAPTAITLNSGTIQDDKGNDASTSLTSVGSTTNVLVDAVAPTFNSAGSTPNDGDSGVAIADDIIVDFSEDIAAGTGNITLYNVTDSTTTETYDISGAGSGTSPTAGTISISSDKLYIDPTSTLSAGKQYSIQVATTAIEDTAGNSFAGITDTTTLNFYTIPLVTLSASPTSTSENGGTSTITATLNQTSSSTVTINLSTSGTATDSGTDYSLSSNSITITAGNTTGTTTLTGVDDAASEGDETAIIDINTVTNGAESGTQSVTITLTDDDNTAPEVDLDTSSGGVDYSVTFTEGGGNIDIANSSNLDVTDADTDTIATVIISLTNDQDGASEYLTSTVNNGNVTVSNNDSDTITLTDAGSASYADFEAVLDGIQYVNSTTTPDTTTRTVTVVANDGTTDGSAATASITVDALPVVSSVSVPSDATYKSGDTLDFTVTFSESVIVDTSSGTPYFELTVGSSTVNASYNGSDDDNSTTHAFRYTVTSTDLDSDGIAVGSAINVNSGTIQDANSNSLTTTLNSVASTTSVLVDGVAPTISDITSSKTDGSYKAGEVIGITLTFSEAVTLSGGGNFQLTLDSGATVDITSISSATTATGSYTVSGGENSSDLTVSSVSVTAGTLQDAAGNDLSTSLTSTTNLATNKALIIDTTAPTVTDANIAISGASGTSGAYMIGDTVTATWDNTGSGDNNSDIATITVDFSAFGGGSAVSATESTNTWTATYTIVSGSIDGTNLNVGATAIDDAGNATTTTDTTNATVDNEAATLTDANISISGASGTSGAYMIGDTITATWDNTGSGDNNGDISTVTVDFSAFGGGSAVSATETTGTWSATYTIVAGSIDSTNLNVSATATDDAGNTTTTSDTTNATVDTIAPTLTDGNISISGASGTSGAYMIGDIVTATWDNTGSGDNNSDISTVTVDFSAFGGGSAVSATETTGTWSATYTIVAGSIDNTNLNVSATATDDAGNST
ncbi:MAG: DUF4347 domain-containing protein, partial [Magnetococcales bacterium]|nr:DUF4347 domain-containing protein [Magnetococcales bacterium]